MVEACRELIQSSRDFLDHSQPGCYPLIHFVVIRKSLSSYAFGCSCYGNLVRSHVTQGGTHWRQFSPPLDSVQAQETFEEDKRWS
jgi:hypothetical protein